MEGIHNTGCWRHATTETSDIVCGARAAWGSREGCAVLVYGDVRVTHGRPFDVWGPPTMLAGRCMYGMVNRDGSRFDIRGWYRHRNGGMNRCPCDIKSNVDIWSEFKQATSYLP